jgi:hypothetical protein
MKTRLLKNSKLITLSVSIFKMARDNQKYHITF